LLAERQPDHVADTGKGFPGNLCRQLPTAGKSRADNQEFSPCTPHPPSSPGVFVGEEKVCFAEELTYPLYALK